MRQFTRSGAAVLGGRGAAVPKVAKGGAPGDVDVHVAAPASRSRAVVSRRGPCRRGPAECGGNRGVGRGFFVPQPESGAAQPNCNRKWPRLPRRVCKVPFRYNYLLVTVVPEGERPRWESDEGERISIRGKSKRGAPASCRRSGVIDDPGRRTFRFFGSSFGLGSQAPTWRRRSPLPLFSPMTRPAW